jgi:hypothetical protein
VFFGHEDALLQVMLGHTGLVAKLIGFNCTGFVHSIPAVVTTGGLFAAQFDVAHVALGTVTVQPERPVGDDERGESRLNIDE